MSETYYEPKDLEGFANILKKRRCSPFRNQKDFMRARRSSKN